MSSKSQQVAAWIQQIKALPSGSRPGQLPSWASVVWIWEKWSIWRTSAMVRPEELENLDFIVFDALHAALLLAADLQAQVQALDQLPEVASQRAHSSSKRHALMQRESEAVSALGEVKQALWASASQGRIAEHFTETVGAATTVLARLNTGALEAIQELDAMQKNGGDGIGTGTLKGEPPRHEPHPERANMGHKNTGRKTAADSSLAFKIDPVEPYVVLAPSGKLFFSLTRFLWQIGSLTTMPDTAFEAIIRLEPTPTTYAKDIISFEMPETADPTEGSKRKGNTMRFQWRFQPPKHGGCSFSLQVIAEVVADLYEIIFTEAIRKIRKESSPVQELINLTLELDETCMAEMRGRANFNDQTQKLYQAAMEAARCIELVSFNNHGVGEPVITWESNETNKPNSALKFQRYTIKPGLVLRHALAPHCKGYSRDRDFVLGNHYRDVYETKDGAPYCSSLWHLDPDKEWMARHMARLLRYLWRRCPANFINKAELPDKQTILNVDEAQRFYLKWSEILAATAIDQSDIYEGREDKAIEALLRQATRLTGHFQELMTKKTLEKRKKGKSSSPNTRANAQSEENEAAPEPQTIVGVVPLPIAKEPDAANVSVVEHTEPLTDANLLTRWMQDTLGNVHTDDRKRWKKAPSHSLPISSDDFRAMRIWLPPSVKVGLELSEVRVRMSTKVGKATKATKVSKSS